MDNIRFPLAEGIDSLLRYGVSGGVLLTYLLIAFPEIFCPNWFGWQYFVIFSFVLGFLMFVLTRIYLDHKEERDYYREIIQDEIPKHIKKLKKSISNVSLARALENYYFWKDDKRAGLLLSKIKRRASYIYFYLSMAIVFFNGAIFLFMSLITENYRKISPFLDIGILIGLSSVLFFILCCKSLKEYIELCEKQKNFAIFLLLLVLLLLIYNTGLYAIHKEILPYGIISVVVSFILSSMFYYKFDSTYKDQKYMWYVMILNELKETPENFENFITDVYRTNEKWRIIDKFLSD